MIKKLKRNWLVVSKLTWGIWQILARAIVSTISTLMGFFCTKCIMFELKKYRGVIFHDTEKWWKIWRKADLWFEKWYEEFGEFSPDHSKVSKLELW